MSKLIEEIERLQAIEPEARSAMLVVGDLANSLSLDTPGGIEMRIVLLTVAKSLERVLEPV